MSSCRYAAAQLCACGGRQFVTPEGSQKEIKATEEKASQKDREETPTKARQAAVIARQQQLLHRQEQVIAQLESKLEEQEATARQAYVS